MIILEALSKLDNLSLEELDLTVTFPSRFSSCHFVRLFQGLTLTPKQISDIEKLFVNQSKLTCYVGPIRQTVEQYANHLLNSIHNYCRDHHVTLTDLFGSSEDKNMPTFMISYPQFLNGLKKAKIPFPNAQIEKIMQHLVRPFIAIFLLS